MAVSLDINLTLDITKKEILSIIQLCKSYPSDVYSRFPNSKYVVRYNVVDKDDHKQSITSILVLEQRYLQNDKITNLVARLFFQNKNKPTERCEVVYDMVFDILVKNIMYDDTDLF